jgi:hypothetical protein
MNKQESYSARSGENDECGAFIIKCWFTGRTWHERYRACQRYFDSNILHGIHWDWQTDWPYSAICISKSAQISNLLSSAQIVQWQPGTTTGGEIWAFWVVPVWGSPIESERQSNEKSQNGNESIQLSFGWEKGDPKNPTGSFRSAGKLGGFQSTLIRNLDVECSHKSSGVQAWCEPRTIMYLEISQSHCSWTGGNTPDRILKKSLHLTDIDSNWDW